MVGSMSVYKELPCPNCGRVHLWWHTKNPEYAFCPEGCKKAKGTTMKFSRIDEHSGTKIEFEVSDESTVDEVLEEFQNFLRACGYVIDYNQHLVLEKMDE